MNVRVFFTLLPIGYWIVVALGIALHTFSETAQLGNILINVGSFLFALRFAVIIHEIGHLLAAKMAGGIPRRVVLGRGHEIYRTKIFNITVIIFSKFRGGFAWASFENMSFLKLRYGFFVVGGVMLNVFVALIIYLLFDFGFDLNSRKDHVSLVIPFTFFLANALMLFNLIPAHNIFGRRTPTDGLALIQLPFKKINLIRRTLDDNLLMDGHEYLERKEFEKALAIFTDYIDKYPDTKILSVSIAHTLLKTGQVSKAIEESTKLLNDINNDKAIYSYAGVIYNQVAWLYLVQGDIQQADHYSQLALSSNPDDQNFQGTRGSVLVEQGHTDQGMYLLFPNMDFRFVNSETLCAAVYLMLGAHQKEVLRERQRYLEFIQTNADKLDADEKILFERNLSRIMGNVNISAKISAE
jgi:tetratricopeptide (TPR) repeat protein